jgi:hypothetical protein
MPITSIVMSISHPRLRFLSMKTSLKIPAGLAAWMGMVHYINTLCYDG